MENLLIIFIAIAIAMGLYAIVLLVFGFLATGATRQKLYSGTKCIMGGRVGAAFFMVLTYLMNLIWMGITAVCTIPIMIYIILRNICQTEYKGSFEDYNFWRESDCFNLSRIGLYKNVTYSIEKNAICGEAEIGNFCEKVEDAGPMFGLALGGSFLVVIGMIHFLMILVANYQRIKVSKEITEHRNALNIELTDSSSRIMENSSVAKLTKYGPK
ncbi:DgyrCDS3634 [Dimorphilus gyrociliatus]|uniref:DgyrCDS3634 n=1 Tax=Dimorphilus gyrociliatus TaxID=2664684 RepID=A0A7I8VGI9_9ANNE|nr:DgyrCDS3634 [Dimorphilus gyrociliatus]